MRTKHLIIFLPLVVVALYAYRWPVKPQDKAHGINATLGEMRVDTLGNPDHFHAGVDIAESGDSIYCPDTSIVDTTEWKSNWIGRFRYIHASLDTFLQGDTILPGCVIGYITGTHLHFRESSTRLSPHDALNPLDSLALTPYYDSTNPHIDSVKFYRQGPGDTLLSKDSLDGKIDVLAVARDTRTDSTGHIPTIVGTTSVYRIGYEVRDTLGNLKKDYWEKIVFDSIPSPPNVSQLQLTYGSGSTNSHFRYWVSNDPFNDTVAHRNWYWNTKQRTGQPDSVDADSIEVAKFKDGFYWVKVYAYDISDNADSESVLVHIDNFAPRVKQTYPSDWFAFVPTKQHKIFLNSKNFKQLYKN